MNLPTEISTDARAVAEWFVFNHAAQVASNAVDELIDDIAQVLADFRAAPARVGLTRQQIAVTNYLAERERKGEQAPSHEEIAADVGFSSKSAVNRVVNQLKERGVVTFIPNKPRSIALVGRA